MLVILSVAHAVASLRMIPLLLLFTLVISLLHRPSLVRGAKIIAVTAIALGILALVVWFTSNNISLSELLLGYLRWISLAAVSIVLFLSINALEMITSLVYFRLPLGIAMAAGIGLRFLPVFFEEARRIRIMQRHRILSKSRLTLRSVGFINTLNRVISPFLISALRRVDLLVLSIAVQDLEQRILNYRFLTFKMRDWVAVLVVVLLLGITLVL